MITHREFRIVFVVAIVMLLSTVSFAEVSTVAPAPATPSAPRTQDPSDAETDQKEVARAISALKPGKEQLFDLLDAHAAARGALKARETAAMCELARDYAAQNQALRKAQAAEKQALVERLK